MAKILITGATGFVGRHLIDYLSVTEHQLFGFGRATSLVPVRAKQIDYYFGDLCDQKMLEQILARVQPDIIFHLAGVLKSNDVQEFYRVNVQGTVALFEAVRAVGIAPKVLVTSSSAVYGPGEGEESITEQFKLRPLTHYAVSKAAQEMVALHYHLAYELNVFCTRTFNLIGPGQPLELACSAFAYQIALAELRREPATLATGNLSSRRDFVDVRDAVCAYDLLVYKGMPGEVYNVCHENAVSIQHSLDILMEMAEVSVTTCVNPARLQSNDVLIQTGSAAKLREQTGWKPVIRLRQSLADLLDDWRNKLRTGTKQVIHEME